MFLGGGEVSPLEGQAMAKKLIATLAAAFVAMMILAGSGTSMARKNSALKQRVAQLEQDIAGLASENALQERRITSHHLFIGNLLDRVSDLQYIEPSQVITRDCAPGEDATWEVIPLPGPGHPGDPVYVRLSC